MQSQAFVGRCASEPFNKTVNTHRTTSETPLPTHADARPKDQMRPILRRDMSAKHMEGGPSTSRYKASLEQKPASGLAEIGGTTLYKPLTCYF